MRPARWLLFASVFLVSAACFPQQSPSAAQAKPAPTVPVRDPHSTPADLAIPLCPAKFDDSLEANGIATSDDKQVTPPKVVHSVEALFPEDVGEVRCTRKKKGFPGFESKSQVSFVVDEHGDPESLCLRETSGYGLDANAANAIQQYTFDSATKNGKPIPYRITVEIDFARSCY